MGRPKFKALMCNLCIFVSWSEIQQSWNRPRDLKNTVWLSFPETPPDYIPTSPPIDGQIEGTEEENMSFDQLFKNLSRTCGFWQVASLICFLSERPAPARIRPCALFSLKSSFCLASGCSVQEKYGSISFAQVFPELSTYIQNQNKHLNIVQINCPPNALEPVFNTTHREPFSTCLYIGIIKQ